MKWQESFFSFFPPAFFSTPSELLASLVPILIVPVSHNWCRETNHNNQIASQCLCGTWQLNIHLPAVKTFTSFQIHSGTFCSGKRHLIHLGVQLVIYCSIHSNWLPLQHCKAHLSLQHLTRCFFFPTSCRRDSILPSTSMPELIHFSRSFKCMWLKMGMTYVDRWTVSNQESLITFPDSSAYPKVKHSYTK